MVTSAVVNAAVVNAAVVNAAVVSSAVRSCAMAITTAELPTVKLTTAELPTVKLTTAQLATVILQAMKTLIVICAVVAATLAAAAEKPAPAPASRAVLTGVVLEVKDAGGYTYLRLKTKEGETWAAVAGAPVRQGQEVTIKDVMFMKDFQSKALNRKFEMLAMGTLAGTGDANAATRHAGNAGATDTPDVKVPKATGANARTVAEILSQGAELKDKPVLVRGKVVRYNAGILGRNWIHLRDGSGSAADGTNDVLVTSTNEVKVGDIVTMKGVVRTNRDFGAGYSYKVLVEEGAIQK